MPTPYNPVQFLQEFFQTLPPVKPISYRIYYDDEGRPTSYTTDDKPGNYIEVDNATFTQPHIPIRIVDGKIVKIPPPVQFAKLIPVDQGVPCDPDNVCVVVNSTQPHKKWSLKNRETY